MGKMGGGEHTNTHTRIHTRIHTHTYTHIHTHTHPLSLFMIIFLAEQELAAGLLEYSANKHGVCLVHKREWRSDLTREEAAQRPWYREALPALHSYDFIQGSAVSRRRRRTRNEEEGDGRDTHTHFDRTRTHTHSLSLSTSRPLDLSLSLDLSFFCVCAQRYLLMCATLRVPTNGGRRVEAALHRPALAAQTAAWRLHWYGLTRAG